MNQTSTKKAPTPFDFVLYGALVALGLGLLLYGIYVQREVPAIFGAVLMSIGYLHIGRLLERRQWTSKEKDRARWTGVV